MSVVHLFTLIEMIMATRARVMMCSVVSYAHDHVLTGLGFSCHAAVTHSVPTQPCPCIAYAGLHHAINMLCLYHRAIHWSLIKGRATGCMMS